MKSLHAIIVCLFSLGASGQAGLNDTPASDSKAGGTKGQAGSSCAPAAGGDLVDRGREFQLAGKPAVALQFYRQAMLAGNPEGAFQSGCLGSEVAETSGGRLKLLKQSAALNDFYRAATNGHAGACVKISTAFQKGKGASASLTHAYLWLKIARDMNPATSMQELDELAIRLTPLELQEAQLQARHYLAGAWPRSVAPGLVEGDTRLRINGLSTGARSTVMINGVTFREGDSAPVAPLRSGAGDGKADQTATLQISCTSIGSDYVLVQVGDETDLRLLSLGIN